MAITWNPRDKATIHLDLQDGNLRAVNTHTANTAVGVRAYWGKFSGKFYFEVTPSFTGVEDKAVVLGVARIQQSLTNYVGGDGWSWGYLRTGVKYNANTETAYGDAFASGDVIGVAVDLEAGKVWFSKNGVWQATGDPAAGTNPAYDNLTDGIYPMVTCFEAGSSALANFGASAFAYAPPVGFSAFDIGIPYSRKTDNPSDVRWNQQVISGASRGYRREQPPDHVKKDIEFGGDGYIAGRVTIDGVGAQRRVAVFERRTRILVAGGWSAADGTYRFDNLNKGLEYFAIALDYTGTYNAMIFDHITPT